MVGWHHRLNEHESEETLEGNVEQGSLGAGVHGVTKSRTELSN